MSEAITLPTEDQWDEFWSMGDVNRDGYINDADLEIIRKSFGCFSDDPCYDAKCDLNKDGIVDMKDSAICAYNQGKNIWDHFGLLKPIDLLKVAGITLAIAGIGVVVVYKR